MRKAVTRHEEANDCHMISIIKVDDEQPRVGRFEIYCILAVLCFRFLLSPCASNPGSPHSVRFSSSSTRDVEIHENHDFR